MLPPSSKTYSLHLDSSAKISGGNHSAVFDVNWSMLLDDKYDQFTASLAFYTAANYFRDDVMSHAVATVGVEFGARTLSYSTSSSSASAVLGVIRRDTADAASASSILFCTATDNAPVTLSRPSQGVIKFSIRNIADGDVLGYTNAEGIDVNDMPAWTAIITFAPVPESYVGNPI